MSNKFMIGSEVKWLAYPRKGNIRGPAIKCVGTVIGVKRSVFGGKRRGMGAMIDVKSRAYLQHYKKNLAFISFKKLERA